MKKFSFLILFALCAVVFLSSCDKEDDDSDSQPASVGMTGYINDSIPFNQFEFSNTIVSNKNFVGVEENQFDILTVLESGTLILTVRYYTWEGKDAMHDGVIAKRYYQSYENADCAEFLGDMYCDVMEATFITEDDTYTAFDPFGPGFIVITKSDLVSRKVSGKFDFTVISKANEVDYRTFTGTFHDLVY